VATSDTTARRTGLTRSIGEPVTLADLATAGLRQTRAVLELLLATDATAATAHGAAIDLELVGRLITRPWTGLLLDQAATATLGPLTQAGTLHPTSYAGRLLAPTLTGGPR
jgi:hypothetical protein